jgi:hypothetical protein
LLGIQRLFGFFREASSDLVFVGTQASVTIKLVARIQATGFTLWHIPKELAPGKDISTAPLGFSLTGLSDVSDSSKYFSMSLINFDF